MQKKRSFITFNFKKIEKLERKRYHNLFFIDFFKKYNE